jgi:hypothetical protein
LRRGEIAFSIVPRTKEQFDMLNDNHFIELLICLDVRLPSYGQMYPKFAPLIKREFFIETMNLFWSTFDKLKDEEGMFTKEKLEEIDVQD